MLVVRQFGEIVGQRGDGFQTIAPWQSAEEVSTQVESQRFQMDDRAAGRGHDQQRACDQRGDAAVYAVVTLNYRGQRQGGQELFTDVGSTFFDKVVAPRVFQVFKNETVKFKSVAVRRTASRSARRCSSSSTGSSTSFSIDVVDFLINDLDFPQEFTQAIERKQVATQDALAARQKVEQSKAEAQQEIERARGQAQAQRLRASSLTDRNLQFEALQILKEAPPQIVFLPAGQGNLLDPSTFLKSAERPRPNRIRGASERRAPTATSPSSSSA